MANSGPAMACPAGPSPTALQSHCKYDAYSLWCKQDLRLRGVMDSTIPDICAFACPLLPCTWLSFQIGETIKPVDYCKIIDKA